MCAASTPFDRGGAGRRHELHCSVSTFEFELHAECLRLTGKKVNRSNGGEGWSFPACNSVFGQAVDTQASRRARHIGREETDVLAGASVHVRRRADDVLRTARR